MSLNTGGSKPHRVFGFHKSEIIETVEEDGLDYEYVFHVPTDKVSRGKEAYISAPAALCFFEGNKVYISDRGLMETGIRDKKTGKILKHSKVGFEALPFLFRRDAERR